MKNAQDPEQPRCCICDRRCRNHGEIIACRRAHDDEARAEIEKRIEERKVA